MTNILQRMKRGAAILAVLAAGIAVPAAVAGIIYLVGQSIIAERESEISVLRDTADRLRSIVWRGEGMPSSDENVRAYGDNFLRGDEDSIVVAELQNKLRKLALSLQIELNSATPLPVKSWGSNLYIGLRMVLRGQISEIQSLLHGIESGIPLLFVERASFRIDTWPIKSKDRARDGAAALVVEIDVYGARVPVAQGETSQLPSGSGKRLGNTMPSTQGTVPFALPPYQRVGRRS